MKISHIDENIQRLFFDGYCWKDNPQQPKKEPIKYTAESKKKKKDK